MVHHREPPELIRNVLEDKKLRDKLSRYAGFSAGTRALLGRPKEEATSPINVAMAVSAVFFLFYALWAQYKGCVNRWLMFYLLCKESCVLMLVLGTASFSFWRISRTALSWLWHKYAEKADPAQVDHWRPTYKETRETVDLMGQQYTQILLFMGRNSSNLLRIYDMVVMIKSGHLNVSRKDFDALLLNVSNMCFSLFIMYSQDQSEAVDQSLFLSIAISLASLLFFLCCEKAILQQHYECLNDANHGRLNKAELLLYISKLKEDFLVDDVNYNYYHILTDPAPPVIRDLPDSLVLPSVAEEVEKTSWVDYAKNLYYQQKEELVEGLTDHPHEH